MLYIMDFQMHLLASIHNFSFFVFFFFCVLWDTDLSTSKFSKLHHCTLSGSEGDSGEKKIAFYNIGTIISLYDDVLKKT